MDSARGYADESRDTGHGTVGDGRDPSSGNGNSVDNAVDEPRLAIGGDERRMHVRAYNHWVSLLRGRAYPSIEDLDPANIADFGPHSVLLDFSGGVDDPGIAFLGRALREECALEVGVTHISQVPSRSLLSRLTDHYLQIIANRAPIGFEAEFLGTRGHNTMYRGILMPFSSDDEAIDYIYGVINWKEMVDAETQARLDAEVADAVRAIPRSGSATAAVWADGPGAGDRRSEEVEPDEATGETAEAESLGDRLLLAQQTAATVRAADTRTRATLYRALGQAHDFANQAVAEPEEYAALLAAAGIVGQPRAPMTPIVKLVFGREYDKTRLTEYAMVLAHARRHQVPIGALPALIEAAEGGIKGVVSAEREARRPAPTPLADAGAVLRERAVLASLKLDADVPQGDYVVLLARATEAGMVDIVATLGGNAAFTRSAMRRAAA